jgi:hypothetical protein
LLPCSRRVLGSLLASLARAESREKRSVCPFGLSALASIAAIETDAYVVGEHLIWDATARILQDLLARLDTRTEREQGELVLRAGQAGNPDR